MEDASQQRQDTSPRKEDIPAHSFADVKNAEKRARQYERQRAAQQEARREQQIGQVQTVRRRHRHRNYIIYYILLGDHYDDCLYHPVPDCFFSILKS